MRKEKEIKLFKFPWKGQRASLSFLSLLKLSPLVSAKYAHIDRHIKLNWRATREALIGKEKINNHDEARKGRK